MKKLFVHASVLILMLAFLVNRDALFGVDLASGIMSCIAGWQIGTWSCKIAYWINERY